LNLHHHANLKSRKLEHIISIVLIRYMCFGDLGYGLDDRGFDSRQRLGIFLFVTLSRSALEPTQPPIQWVPGDLSLGVKRPGLEAKHSPPSSKVKGKVVPILLTKHHAMKTYWGSGGIALCIIDLGTGWR
jgi:hypothetical protein